MGWTAPRSWVTGEVVTAAQLNEQIRDNSNALVTTRSAVVTIETTTSTTYANLTTVGPEVTVVTITEALVIATCQMANNTAGGQCFASVAVSGATTLAASDDRAVIFESSAANDVSNMSRVFKITGLTAGSNTFTMKYRVNTGTGSFTRRELLVVGV